MSEDMERLPSDQGSDPIPAREVQNGNRTKQYVTEISAQAKGQLGEMRDQIDDVVRAITSREEKLVSDIEAHIQAVATSIKAKLIIEKAMVDVAKHFEPLPKPTITQRNGGGDH